MVAVSDEYITHVTHSLKYKTEQERGKIMCVHLSSCMVKHLVTITFL